MSIKTKLFECKRSIIFPQLFLSSTHLGLLVTNEIQGEYRMSKVSIVVPVYNAEEYILKCLDSLQAQSFSDIKIICIENGSTDNSWDKITSRKDDSRLIAMRMQEANVSYARNLGLFWALKYSPYVMFCDADDTYDLSMVESMYDTIEQSSSDLVCCEINVDYQSDYELKQSDDDYYSLKFEGKNTNINEVINHVDYSLCNKIFRTSIIKNYSITFPVSFHYEDACFCWKYLSVIDSVFFIKKKLYNYIRHANSIMNKTFAKSNKSIDHIKITENIYNFLTKHNVYSNYHNEFHDFYDACVGFAKLHCRDDGWKAIELLDEKLQKNFFLER